MHDVTYSQFDRKWFSTEDGEYMKSKFPFLLLTSLSVEDESIGIAVSVNDLSIFSPHIDFKQFG